MLMGILRREMCSANLQLGIPRFSTTTTSTRKLKRVLETAHEIERRGVIILMSWRRNRYGSMWRRLWIESSLRRVSCSVSIKSQQVSSRSFESRLLAYLLAQACRMSRWPDFAGNDASKRSHSDDAAFFANY